MKASDIDVALLLPHAGPMLLLERLLFADQSSARAHAVVKNNGMFNVQDTVPMWVGIEYMAQTTAAYAGYQAYCAGEKPKIGFLLGTRKYTSHIAQFHCGQNLIIESEEIFRDSNMGSFACKIYIENILQVWANLSVFQPNDEMLNKMRHS